MIENVDDLWDEKVDDFVNEQWAIGVVEMTTSPFGLPLTIDLPDRQIEEEEDDE